MCHYTGIQSKTRQYSYSQDSHGLVVMLGRNTHLYFLNDIKTYEIFSMNFNEGLVLD